MNHRKDPKAFLASIEEEARKLDKQLNHAIAELKKLPPDTLLPVPPDAPPDFLLFLAQRRAARAKPVQN